MEQLWFPKDHPLTTSLKELYEALNESEKVGGTYVSQSSRRQRLEKAKDAARSALAREGISV